MKNVVVVAASTPRFSSIENGSESTPPSLLADTLYLLHVEKKD
jgi:hypothetical protein